MRILHSHNEIAGQMGILSSAQRSLGVESYSIGYGPHRFQYKCDRDIILIESKNGLIQIIDRCLKTLPLFLESLHKYDVYHFHHGGTFFYHYDLPLLKRLKKKLVMHFWGCDIRDKEYVTRNYKISACKECKSEEICTPARGHKIIEVTREYFDAVFVGSPDLLDFYPEADFIPVALDLEKWVPNSINKKESKRANGLIKIFHAPSNRSMKGTSDVIEAADKLKEEGYPIQLVLVEGIPTNRVREHYLEADIVVDQLLAGWYGLFAVETMALEKPVLCYIREDMKKYAPDLPIINTNPENIYENLKFIIEDPELRRERGEKGRAYVEKVHDSKKIAGQLIETYKNL